MVSGKRRLTACANTCDAECLSVCSSFISIFSYTPCNIYFKGIQQNIPNIFIPFSTKNGSQIRNITPLENREKTIIPNNSQLILGNDYTLNCRNPKLQDLLDKKGAIVVGTSPTANISVPQFYNGVNSTHLQIEKQGSKIIATDLSSTQGTEIIPKDKIKAFQHGTENLKLAQGEIGDCFVLATLYSLSRTPIGQKMLENMVQVDDNGNYIVTFNNKKPITITPQELDSERKSENKDWACGEMGTKAIERAHAKSIKTNLLMLNSAQIDKGGRITDALEIITGKKCTKHKLSEENIDTFLNSITKKGLENQFLTCSTPHNGNYGKFMNSKSKFITGHAYSIKNIDTKEKTIEIVNPHNTKKSEVISWDNFKSMFGYVYIATM